MPMASSDKTMKRCQARGKFTLIELLVVIAIIGILASLLLPALRRAKDMAMTLKRLGHLKQPGLAETVYNSACLASGLASRALQYNFL